MGSAWGLGNGNVFFTALFLYNLNTTIIKEFCTRSKRYQIASGPVVSLSTVIINSRLEAIRITAPDLTDPLAERASGIFNKALDFFMSVQVERKELSYHYHDSRREGLVYVEQQKQVNISKLVIGSH